MANELTYQSDFTGQEMDERFTAVAQLQAALAEGETALSAKYVKPASGIPETDLDSAVQSALAKARSAVQDLSNYYTKTEIDSLLAAVNSQEYVDVATLPTASASTLGKIYLVGPTNNQYDRYYTSYNGSAYSWVAAGSTEINLSNYATKADLMLIYGKQSHTFNATSAEHGSKKDLYPIVLKAGETLKGVVTQGTGVCDGTQMRVYVFNSAQTAITFVPFTFGEEFSITPASDAAYLGVYLYNVTTLGTFNIEFSTESIVGDLQDQVDGIEGKVDEIVSFQDTTGVATTANHGSNAGNAWIIVNKPSVAAQDGFLRKIKAYVSGATSFWVCVGDLDSSTLNFTVRKQQLVTLSGSSAGVQEAVVNLPVKRGQYIGVHGDGSHTLPAYGAAITGSGGWYWKSSNAGSLVEGDTIGLSDLSNYSLAFGWALEYSKFEYAKTDPVIVEITATRNAADFNSIRETIAAITDASEAKQYIINVPKGRWFECDLNGKRFVKVRGESMEGTVLYCDGTSDKLTPADYSRSSYRGVALSTVPQDQKHCVFALADVAFENLTIEANDVKYCVHLDNAGFESASFDRVHFLVTANANYPVGIGIRGGQSASFTDCVLERVSSGGLGFTAHNLNNQAHPSVINFIRCAFKGVGFGVIDELGSDQDDFWNLVDCVSDMGGEGNFMVDKYNGATYWTNPSTNEKETDPTAVPYCITLNAVGSNVRLVTRELYDDTVARPNADKYINGASFVCVGSTGLSVGDVICGYRSGRGVAVNSALPVVGVVDSIIGGVAYVATEMVLLPNSAIGGTPAIGAPVYVSEGRLTTVASGAAVGVISQDRITGHKVVTLF